MIFQQICAAAGVSTARARLCHKPLRITGKKSAPRWHFSLVQCDNLRIATLGAHTLETYPSR